MYRLGGQLRRIQNGEPRRSRQKMGREEKEGEHDIRQAVASSEILLRQANPHQNTRQEVHLQVPL